MAPSKENYRKKRGEAANREWLRIKTFETLVGWKCRQAARPGQLKEMFGSRLNLEVLLYHQRVDPDNLKSLIDGLKGVLYPDDSKRYIRRLEVIVADDEKEEVEAPMIVMRVGVWE